MLETEILYKCFVPIVEANSNWLDPLQKDKAECIVLVKNVLSEKNT